MAKKTIENITSGTVERTATSKGKYWQYTDTTTPFTIKQITTDGYSNIYYPLAVKDGDNTLVITKFLNKTTNKVTTIVDTITNYTDENSIKVDYGNDTNPITFLENISGSDSINIVGETKDKYVYDNKKNTKYTIENNTGWVMAIDEKGADTYDLNGGTSTDNVYIRDYAGGDTYNVASTQGFDSSDIPEIYDYAGNDKYNFGYLENSIDAMAKVFDYKGNDTYKATSTTNSVDIYDYAGKDKYELDGVKPERNFSINDTAGNDTYTIKNSDLSNESGKITITDNAGNDKYTLTKVTSTQNNTEHRTDITDKAGKDTYKITDSTNTHISDFNSAKDSYTATNSTNVTIIDGSNLTGKTSGNDKYTFTNTKSYSALDYDGNENYTVLGGSGDLTDFAGNDKYKVNAKKDYDISRLTIADSKGQDAYTVSGAKATKTDEAVYVNRVTINDSGEILKDAKGKDIKKSANDTYKLSYIDNTSDNSYKITDKAGDDKYTITNSDGIRIEDEAGKDTYTISGTAKTKSAGEIDVDLLKIADNSGDDTYKLSFINNSSDLTNYYVKDTEGNDKYTVSNSYSMRIVDNGGNDTFNYKNVFNAYVESSATSNKGDTTIETNTFNFTDITGAITIRTNWENYNNENTPATGTKKEGVDKLSIDTYNINYTGNSTVLNMGVFDYDEGNDIYNVKSSTKLNIEDAGGNDKYSFTKSLATSTFSITDLSGDDTYTIDKVKGIYTLDDKAGTKANIVFMADINDSKTGRLFAYDKNNGGYVEMLNYFQKSDSKLTADGDGLIESIKVGNKDATVDTNYINEVQSDVTTFLKGIGEGTTITDVLNGDSAKNIDALVAYFTKNN